MKPIPAPDATSSRIASRPSTSMMGFSRTPCFFASSSTIFRVVEPFSRKIIGSFFTSAILSIGLFGFNDLERGEKVVAKADKLNAEPEDIAYGQMIAKNLFDIINKLDSNVSPEDRDDFLQDIYKLDNDEFKYFTKFFSFILQKLLNEQNVNIVLLFFAMAINNGIEKPDYKVVKKYNNFELRDYGSIVIATTSLERNYSKSNSVGKLMS